MRVILFGATGMVGQGVLRECLRDPGVERVLALVRAPMNQAHDKLRPLVVRDFLDLAPLEGELSGYDACFFCLGVTSAGMTEDAYRRVTYDVTMTAATTLARLNPGMTFVFVSGAGADSSESGRVMWARIKGKTENAVMRLPFKASYVLRPAYIQPRHGIQSRTRMYRLLYRVVAPLYPILKALGRDRPVGMVHIDAHCDSAGEYEGSKFHHGGPFRQAVLDGVLDPERSIQIGIRGGAEYLWEFSYESGMTVLHAEDVVEIGTTAVVAKAREVVGDGPIYVTFDVDGIDPGFAPGTGTPEVGGLTPREALAILRGIAGLDVIGGDVVEVAPQYDATTNTAQVGAQMLFTELCLVAANPKRHRKP